MNNQRRFDPFDLESADELGILGDGSRSAQKLDIQNAAKQLASTTFLPDRPNYERNIMNGLFACNSDLRYLSSGR